MRTTADRAGVPWALALAGALAASGCGGRSPEPPPSTSGPIVPGVTVVTGRERMAWTQADGGRRLAFVAYVDDVAVRLDAASCTPGSPDMECAAPLPTMADGVRTIAIAAVDVATGAEGERSEPIRVQKVAARATASPAALPDAGAGAGRVALSASGGVPGLTFAPLAADVVARDVRMPAQLGVTPDGRLLVAEAGGRVRLVHPDDPGRQVVALEAAALFDPPPAGDLALAVAPDFAASRHVFVAYTHRDNAGQARTRIVRLREAGDTLGEPATVFDAPIAPEAGRDGETAVGSRPEDTRGPRLAFGPDGLLYALLPPGLAFDGQPAASTPLAAVARLTPEGRTPVDGGLKGLTRHPLAVAWHPATRQLLGLLPDGPARALVRPLGGRRAGTDDGGIARFRADDAGAGPVLRFDALTAEGALSVAQAAAGTVAALPAGVVRLAVPADLDGLVPGLDGRLEDLVSRDGVIYAAVSTGAARSGDATGVIVRLRP